MRISFELPPWPPGFDADASARLLDAASDTFALWAQIHPLPPLFETDIRYRLEPNHGTGIERFDNPWDVLQRGWGDCDDLVAYRLTELKAAGVRATAHRTKTRSNWQGKNIHVLVRLSPTQFEDPSLLMLRKNG